MTRLFIVMLMLLAIGCGTRSEQENPTSEQNAPDTEQNVTHIKTNSTDTEKLSAGEIIKQVNASGTITNAQAERLGKVRQRLELNSLTSITDQQAESLNSGEGLEENIDQNNRYHIELNGLTSISNQQAENLSKIGNLELNGLTSITDQQAVSLGKTGSLELGGLTSITDEQAKSLSKVRLVLVISDACYDVVSKYMKIGLTKASEKKY